MKKQDMTQNVESENSWQILAELDLIPGTEIKRQVESWAQVISDKLGLIPEVIDTILDSALEAVSRIVLPLNEDKRYPGIKIRGYAPLVIPIRSKSSKNWGFFRIDKHGFSATGNDREPHLIEFYVYLER
jgi:hypothetical protein